MNTRGVILPELGELELSEATAAKAAATARPTPGLPWACRVTLGSRIRRFRPLHRSSLRAWLHLHMSSRQADARRVQPQSRRHGARGQSG